MTHPLNIPPGTTNGEETGASVSQTSAPASRLMTGKDRKMSAALDTTERGPKTTMAPSKKAKPKRDLAHWKSVKNAEVDAAYAAAMDAAEGFPHLEAALNAWLPLRRVEADLEAVHSDLEERRARAADIKSANALWQGAAEASYEAAQRLLDRTTADPDEILAKIAAYTAISERPLSEMVDEGSAQLLGSLLADLAEQSASLPAAAAPLPALEAVEPPHMVPCPTDEIASSILATLAEEDAEWAKWLPGDDVFGSPAAQACYERREGLRDQLADTQAASLRGATLQVAVALTTSELIRGNPEQSVRDAYHTTVEKLLKSALHVLAPHLKTAFWPCYVGGYHPLLEERSAWDEARSGLMAQRLWLLDNPKEDTPQEYYDAERRLLHTPAPDLEAALYKFGVLSHSASEISHQGAFFNELTGAFPEGAAEVVAGTQYPDGGLAMLAFYRDLQRIAGTGPADASDVHAGRAQLRHEWNVARSAVYDAFNRHEKTDDDGDFDALCRAQEHWESLTPPDMESFAEVMGYALDHFGPLALACQNSHCPHSMRDLLDSNNIGERIAGRFYLHALRMAGRDTPAMQATPLTGLYPPFDPAAVGEDENYADAWEQHHRTAKPYPGAVASLQATLDDARARVEATTTDEAAYARSEEAARIEDRLRQLPCISDEVALAHARIIARDVSTGERFAAAVHYEKLADGLLRHFGEVF